MGLSLLWNQLFSRRWLSQGDKGCNLTLVISEPPQSQRKRERCCRSSLFRAAPRRTSQSCLSGHRGNDVYWLCGPSRHVLFETFIFPSWRLMNCLGVWWGPHRIQLSHTLAPSLSPAITCVFWVARVGFVEEKRLIHLPLPINCRLNMSDQTAHEEEDYIRPASSGNIDRTQKMDKMQSLCAKWPTHVSEFAILQGCLDVKWGVVNEWTKGRVNEWVCDDYQLIRAGRWFWIWEPIWKHFFSDNEENC